MLPFTGALILLIIYAGHGISPALSASVAGKRGKGIKFKHKMFS